MGVGRIQSTEAQCGSDSNDLWRFCGRCLSDSETLETHYQRFYLYVFGSCKSAGTLLACGAHEVVLSVRGELGPLDVQLAKRDELFGRASGLDISRSLDFITEQSFRIFEDHFLKLIERSDGALSTKTASEISKSMCVGLLAPITQQIDPMQLGEIHRAMNVAFEYGRRLDVDEETLRTLITRYPAHGFVIDLEEAKSLFREVREPNDLELKLESELAHYFLSKFEKISAYAL